MRIFKHIATEKLFENLLICKKYYVEAMNINDSEKKQYGDIIEKNRKTILMMEDELINRGVEIDDPEWFSNFRPSLEGKVGDGVKNEFKSFEFDEVISLHQQATLKEQSNLKTQTDFITSNLPFYLNCATIIYGVDEKEFIWEKLIPFLIILKGFESELSFYRNMFIYDYKFIEGFIENNSTVDNEKLHSLMKDTIIKDINFFIKDQDNLKEVISGASTLIFQGRNKFEEWFNDFWEELPNEFKGPIEELRKQGRKNIKYK